MDQATFSLLDAATYLGISRRSLGALVAKRSITHRRIGPGAGRVVFTRQDLDEYLDRCVVEQVEQ